MLETHINIVQYTKWFRSQVDTRISNTLNKFSCSIVQTIGAQPSDRKAKMYWSAGHVHRWCWPPSNSLEAGIDVWRPDWRQQGCPESSPPGVSIWLAKLCWFCWNLMDSFRCDCTITIKFASGQQSKENNLWQWFLTQQSCKTDRNWQCVLQN